MIKFQGNVSGIKLPGFKPQFVYFQAGLSWSSFFLFFFLNLSVLQVFICKIVNIIVFKS